MGVEGDRPGATVLSDPDWIVRHRAAWATKPALAEWYSREIFARLDRNLLPGRKLQIGVGPGFYARGRPDFVNADLGSQQGVDASCDAHALPFAAATFSNVVGIDVLHHLAAPGKALAEISRVLAPGGTCLLVEPWAGPVGWIVYRHFHHEDCAVVADPWREAFAPGKDALDGNAWLPRTLLWRRAGELGGHAPDLAVESVEAFGLLGYLATGGFQGWGAPVPVVRCLRAAEAALPQAVLRAIALRAFFVLRRTGG